MKTKNPRTMLAGLLATIILFCSNSLIAQTTDFTYQGRLLDSSLPPTANYDFQFSLWDALANGTQVGTTQPANGVAVTNGIFTVRLDFGSTAFADGGARFLQIGVRQAGGGAYTTLAPRQTMTSAPHAIKSLKSNDADNLGGVAANQYLQTNGGTTGSIPLFTGSTAIGNSLISQTGTTINMPSVAAFAPTNGFQTQIGTPNSETGITFFGAATRADIRYGANNGTLKIVNGPSGGPPAETSGIVINTSGNVGIGTANLINGRVNVVSNNSGTAVFGQNTGGGLAGRFEGNVSIIGLISVTSLGPPTGGQTQLCLNGASLIASCLSSSLRYKTAVQPFSPGLALVRRLRPVAFQWKADGTPDLGFIAEEVAEVEPLLAFRNDRGEIEGVKYDRIGVVLVNAVKEQQTQIEAQQKLIEQQQKQIDALKKLVCPQNPTAEICKEEK